MWHPVTRQRSGGRLAARASRGRASGSSEHGPHHTQSGLRRCLKATQLPNRVPQSVTPVLSGLHPVSLSPRECDCEFRRGETLGLGTGIDWGVPRLRRTRVRSRRFSKKRSSLARPEHRPACSEVGGVLVSLSGTHPYDIRGSSLAPSACASAGVIRSPEYHVRIAPHRKPCQQFTLGYVRKSYIH